MAAVLGFMAARGSQPGLLFQFQNGQPMTRPRVCGGSEGSTGTGRGGGGGGGINSSRYSGHSFQIEAATTAAQVGMGDATIKAMGRWSLSRLCPEHLAGIPWRLVDRNAD